MSRTALHIVQCKELKRLNTDLLEQFLARREQPGVRQSHFFGGRYENVYLDSSDVPALARVVEVVSGHAAEILRAEPGQLRCGCWFNYMGPGHATTTHSHDDDDELLSAVYYVKVPENSGNLEFPGSGLSAHVPSAGECVFFAANLAHRVAENRSADYRLSIAFNFGPLHSPQI